MKLQYHEEIVECSSALQHGENTVDDTSTRSAIDVENSSVQNGTRSHQHRSSLTSHEWKLLQIIIIWVIILSSTSLMSINNDDVKFVIGIAVNLNLIFFYAAPLSSIVVVIRTKSSSSIHPCTMIMNTINSFFWCIYSLAIQDYYILIPNGLGFLFGLAQMILYNCYPRIATSDEMVMSSLNLFDEDGVLNDDLID
jgi:uncharacterized protein with PQ loop repeat